jgi:hypothetical protein
MRSKRSNNRRPPLAPDTMIPLALSALFCTFGQSEAPAQEPGRPPPAAPASVAPATPAVQPPTPQPANAQPPRPAGGTAAPSPSEQAAGGARERAGVPNAPALSILDTQGVQLDIATGTISGSGGVTVRYANATLTSDRVEGSYNREIVFSGNAKIDTQGATAYADAIHVYPRSRSFRLDNPRGVLLPEFLRERITEPVYISGGEFAGTTTGYFLADAFIATTCREHFHHYEFRIEEAELFPHEKLILRHVSVYFFGVKVITLPTLVIPLRAELPNRRPRTDYLPEFGQNEIEGYYARFPYSFPEGDVAATFLRLDITQKKGEGYRFEQEYLAGKQASAFNTSYAGPQNGGFTGSTSGTIATAYGYGNTGRLPNLGTGLGPQNGGLLSLQGYFGEGFDRDFNASYRHQQGLGSNNRIAFTTEIQRNSSYVGSDQSNQTSRFNFNHTDPTHGVTSDVTVGLNTTSSGFTGTDFHSSQLTGSYHQSFDFSASASTRNTLTYSFDLTRSTSDSDTAGTVTASRSARLDSEFQFQHASREYTLSLQANKTTPIGVQTDNSGFGTLERLPELLLSTDTYNFKGGFLHQLPLRVDIGVGRYSEPSHNFQDDRAVLGFTLQPTTIVKGRTEIQSGGSFEQRVYSDGAAQYIVRNQTSLRQHLGGRSGIDLRYDYSQPEGGTPFQFDTFGRSHSITAEAGYLDDRHFQLTARVGYDFLGTSQLSPFQSLTTRLMWRPTSSFRADVLSTYDPNTGKFFSITNRLALRAKDDFAVDLITRIDPQQPGIRRKLSQINLQFQTPIGRTWHANGLLRYNGATGKFDSINLEALHEWDCMEASLTYTENPFAFRNDREIFLTLRIKGLPFSRSFARGPAGETLGVGLGDFD